MYITVSHQLSCFKSCKREKKSVKEQQTGKIDMGKEEVSEEMKQDSDKYTCTFPQNTFLMLNISIQHEGLKEEIYYGNNNIQDSTLEYLSQAMNMKEKYFDKEFKT